MLGVPVRSTRVIGTVLAVLLTAAAVTLAGSDRLRRAVRARRSSGCSARVARRCSATPCCSRPPVSLGALIVVLADAVDPRPDRRRRGASPFPPASPRRSPAPSCSSSSPAGAATPGPPGSRRAPAWASAAAAGSSWCSSVSAAAVVGCLVARPARRAHLAADRRPRLWAAGRAGAGRAFALDERAPRVRRRARRRRRARPGRLAGPGDVPQPAGRTRADRHHRRRRPRRGPRDHGRPAGTTGLLVAAVVGALAGVRRSCTACRGAAGSTPTGWCSSASAVWYGFTALSTYLLLRANPWDTPRIYTWLSGTTYGRNWDEVVPGGAGARRGAAARPRRPPRAGPARPRRRHAAARRRAPRAAPAGVVLGRRRRAGRASASPPSASSAFVGLVAPARRPRPGGRPARPDHPRRRAARRRAARRWPTPSGGRSSPRPSCPPAWSSPCSARRTSSTCWPGRTPSSASSASSASAMRCDHTAPRLPCLKTR